MLPGRRRLIAEGYLALVVTRLALRLIGYQRTLRCFAGRTLQRPALRLAQAAATDIDEILSATAVARRHFPADVSCLHYCVAIWWLLHRRGVASEIVFGVAKNGETLLIHAWLECNGVVVSDAPGVLHDFRRLRPSFEALARSRKNHR